MNELMSLAEIEEQFESEWVLIADPVMNERHEIASGRVLWHSKDRDEVDRKLLETRPKLFATLYTGEIPHNAAVIL